jgi:hypothetical protein
MAPMDVATTFLPLLQVFAMEMTAPTFQTVLTLVAGWLLAPRRTILGMVRASGTPRHHAAFHRLFAAAAWSIDRVGLAVFDLVTGGMTTVFLAVDDTLVPRHGLKIFGTGMHRDPLLSSRGHVVTRWGHSWVVLCVVIESRHFPGRQFSLPVLCRLYLNQASAAKWKRTYHKKSDLTREMLQLLDRHLAGTGKRLHLLGDSAFTAPELLSRMPAALEVTGRVAANVRLHEPPPPRSAGQTGRPRRRGARLPSPREMLKAAGLKRMTLKLFAGRAYQFRVATQVCRFYKVPERDVLVIAIEHLRGGRGTEVFYTTDLDADVETILRRYSWRWSIEVTFHDTKQHLGIEEPQNRTRPAARRTAPTALLLYSLIVWWHEQVREHPAPALRAWRGKPHPSFADILAALRLETLETTRQTHFSTPGVPPNIQKYLDHLTRLFELAT